MSTETEGNPAEQKAGAFARRYLGEQAEAVPTEAAAPEAAPPAAPVPDAGAGSPSDSASKEAATASAAPESGAPPQGEPKKVVTYKVPRKHQEAPPPAAPAVATLDEEAAKRIGQETARALAEAQAKSLEVEFEAEERETIALIHVLEEEKVYPQGAADKVKRVLAAIAEKELDPDGAEARKLWEGLGFGVTERDLARAEGLRRERPWKARLAAAEEGREALEKQVLSLRLDRVAERAGAAAARQAAKALAPEAGLADRNGLDEEKLEEFAQSGATGQKIAQAIVSARNWAAGAQATIALLEQEAAYTGKGKTPPKWLVEEINGSELMHFVAEASAKLPGVEDGEGRAFVAPAEYEKLPAEARAGHWTITLDNAIPLGLQRITQGAKQAAERVTREKQTDRSAVEAELRAKLAKEWGVDPATGKPAGAGTMRTEKPKSPAALDPAVAAAAPSHTQVAAFERRFLGR